MESSTVSFGKNIKVQLHQEKPCMELVQEKVAQLELTTFSRENAFFLGDLGDIVRKYEKWSELLPRVEPFYAVKCNDDPAVLRMLAKLGAGFDCASMGEIKSVLKLGVDPSRIIYANPCKQTSFIQYAQKKNVDMMTFDNEFELIKIKRVFPNAQLVLRILPPANFKVQCQLGNKFGCLPRDAQVVLEKAKQLDLNVIGVSFHVGSGAQEAEAYSAAVAMAAEVFNVGQSLGFHFDLLDIGGGFPGHKSSPIAFDDIAVVLNKALNKYFPARRNVRIIAEPGRFFVASAFSLTVTIISKRSVRETGDQDRDGKGAFMYYVNDGAYGSFNCLMYDHAEVKASLVNAPVNPMEFLTSVWGPTCDGLDQIMKNARLPELEVGDRLHFPDMGAYTMAAGSTFNGMPRPDIYYHCSESLWHSLFSTSTKVQLSNSFNKKRCQIPLLKTGHALDDSEILALSPSAVPVSVPVFCHDDEIGH